MARRMFGHGELHLVVLALLQREPMHGYQLLGALAALFAPHYKPSPGSLYPSVQALHDVGLVAGVDEGGRRVYHVTDAGIDALDKRRVELVALEARTGVRVRASRDLETALEDFTARIKQGAASAPLEDVQYALDQAAEHICGLRTSRKPSRTSTRSTR